MSSKAAASDDQKKASAAPDTTAALTTVVKVETDDKYQNVRIDDLPIKKSLRKQCKRMKYTAARAVQAACIPHILRGEDVYAAAKTGSGKTAAFALPILDRLMEDPYGIFAVVLTPTRELAYQIADQFYTFGKVANLRHCIITGGVDMVEEQNALSRLPHVVVATPGRLAAHITSGAEVDLSRVQFLVLDEADRLMTNASMQPDLTTIYNALPPERQNLLFSATLLDEPAGPIAHQLHQPLYRFAVRSDEATVATLVQKYVLTAHGTRLATFVTLLEALDDDASAIVFTGRRETCETIAQMLRSLSHRCVALHGQMSQPARLRALAKFRSGDSKLLVATDVASRGLDIPNVRYVINFTLPRATEDYIHRVGRTARAGEGGMALSLVAPRDLTLLKAVEKDIHVRMDQFELQNDDVVKNLNRAVLAYKEAQMNLEASGFQSNGPSRKQSKQE